MTEAEILAAIDSLSPAMQRAYLDQIKSTVDAAVIAEVQRKIEEGDDEGLVALLGLGSLAVFLELIRAAYIKGGNKPKEKPPGGKPVQFDQHQAEAQEWLSSNASRAADLLREESAEAVRAVGLPDRSGRRRPHQWADRQPLRRRDWAACDRCAYHPQGPRSTAGR
jgi:hypothetical protein